MSTERDNDSPAPHPGAVSSDRDITVVKGSSRLLRVASSEWETATRLAPILPHLYEPPHPAEVLRYAMKLGLSALTSQQKNGNPE